MQEEVRTRRPWLWAVIVGLLLLAAVIVLIVVLLTRGSGTPAPDPTPTPTVSETPAPSPTPPTTPTPSPEPTLSNEDRENVEESISSGNTAALEGYLANPVIVIICASDGIGPRTPAQAVADVTGQIAGAGTWDFDLDDPTVTSYRDGFYTQYFPDDVIVGRSADDRVIAMSPVDDAIGTIFFCVDEALLLE